MTELGEVRIVPHYGWRRVAYYLGCIVAVVLDGSMIATDPPYDIELIDRKTAKCIYREGVYYGNAAGIAAEQIAAQLDGETLSEFVFKKTHGWNIRKSGKGSPPE